MVNVTNAGSKTQNYGAAVNATMTFAIGVFGRGLHNLLSCGCRDPVIRPLQVGVSSEVGNAKLVIRFENLLKTTLESCLKTMVAEEPTKLTVGDVVNTLGERAHTILKEGRGKRPCGKCLFSSAYEAHMFYKFRLSYLGVWSRHNIGQDDDVDAVFYFQLATICEILKILDTSAVFLPDETDQNIQGLKREALWTNFFDGKIKKGEAVARRCRAIGKD